MVIRISVRGRRSVPPKKVEEEDKDDNADDTQQLSARALRLRERKKRIQSQEQQEDDGTRILYQVLTTSESHTKFLNELEYALEDYATYEESMLRQGIAPKTLRRDRYKHYTDSERRVLWMLRDKKCKGSFDEDQCMQLYRFFAISHEHVLFLWENFKDYDGTYETCINHHKYYMEALGIVACGEAGRGGELYYE
jgi:hypothetical protein